MHVQNVGSWCSFKNAGLENNQVKHESYQSKHVYTFGNHKVTPQDIKEPFAVAESVGLTALLTYATVYCAAEIALFKFAPHAGVKFESILKNISQKTISTSNSLLKDKSEGIIPASKRFTGNALGKIEEKSKKMYKAISNWGMTKSSDDEERATKALSNLIGLGAVGINLFNKCTKDTDGDGVRDIFQTKFG